MARTIQEPVPTPVRASTSSVRIQSTAVPVSRIPVRSTTSRHTPSATKGTSMPLPRPSTVNKRAVLGEREDNTFFPPPAPTSKRKSRPSQIIVNPVPAAHSPARIPSGTWSIRAPAASSSTLPRPPRPSFTRLNAGMDEDVTQLLDIQPSSPGGTTDDDWFSGTEEVGNVTAGRTPMPRKSTGGWGKAVEGGGRMMTPMNSQEIPVSAAASASMTKRIQSRLPTPPSSQPPDVVLTPQRPSPPSRRRARPSPTPPRQLTAEVEAAEPSPNPRVRKNPRLASLGSVNNLRQSPAPAPADAVLSVPTARKGKGRASSAKPRASVARASPTAASARSSLSKSPSPSTAPTKSRRKSTAATQRRTSLKPRARKSTTPTSPPSALARYAGVDPRRKSVTTAALRRLTGHNLVIGAGVDSVESSPSDDPLLLKSSYDSDTEVDEEEDEVSSRRAKSSTLIGSSQTEPRSWKNKSRTSGIGFSQSSIKAALSKSTISASSSKVIVTSFPFKPYTNEPAPPRTVPEWVPRTMKKKKVELEYGLDKVEVEADEEMGNGSFDYDAGGYAGGFGSDAGSDFGDGYAGDDTFMNILARRDGVKAVPNAAADEEEEDPMAFGGPSNHHSRSPSLHPHRAKSATPAFSPSSPQHAIDTGSNNPDSPFHFNDAQYYSPDRSAGGIDHFYDDDPLPAHNPVEDDADRSAGSALGLSQMGAYQSPSRSSVQQPYLDEDDEDDDKQEADASQEEMDTTVEVDTTAEADNTVEANTTADMTIEGVSGSWDESAESLRPEEISPQGPADEEESEMEPEAHGEDELDLEVELDTGVSEHVEEEPLQHGSPAAQAASPQMAPAPETLGMVSTVELTTVISLESVLQATSEETTHVTIASPQTSSPRQTPQIVQAPIFEKFSSFSPRATPPRSPFRLFHRAEPTTPGTEAGIHSVPLFRSPLIVRTPISVPCPTSASPRQAQSFDEAARSSLSASQISESEGDITIDAIKSGWESDESVVVKESEVVQEDVEEQEVSELFADDQRAAGPEEADEGGARRAAADIFMREESFGRLDEEEDSFEADDEPSAAQAGEPTAAGSERSPSAPPSDAAPAADDDHTTPGNENRPAQSSDIPRDGMASNSNPSATTSVPGQDDKIVLGLITRIIKREPEDEGAPGESSEEEIEDEADDEEAGAEEEGEEQEEDEAEDEEEEVREEEDEHEEQGDEEEQMNAGIREQEEEEGGGISEADGLESEEDQPSVETAEEDASMSLAEGEVVAEANPVRQSEITTSTVESSRETPATPSRLHVPLSTTPLTSPPRSTLASQRTTSTPAEQPATIPAQDAGPSIQRAGSPALSSTSQSAPVASSSLMPRRRSNNTLRPSGLSHQITGDTTETSPARPIVQATASTSMSAGSSSSSSSERVSESPFVDEGVSVRSAGKSLLAELARAGGKGKQKELRGVVEVSSLDPRAAARAAAILKLNHNYIEHGILPSGSSTSGESPTQTTTPKKLHHSRRKSYTSHHFDSVAAARKLSPEELLNEAELEIVVNETDGGPPPRRHRREGTAFSAVSGVSGLTNFPVPGGWVRTPKRKRRTELSVGVEEERAEPEVPAGKAWGIPEWKRLEKVYREEKEAWVKEREVKSMPGGLMAWARRSTFGKPSDEVTPWDEGRVVRRFLESEGVAQGKEGVWAEDVILLRIQALDRRIANKPSFGKAGSDGSPKKRARVEAAPISTPKRTNFGQAAEAAPASTLKRVLGWVWGSSFTPTVKGSEEGSAIAAGEGKGKGRDEGERPNFDFAPGLGSRSILPIAAQTVPQPMPMKEVSARPASTTLAPPPRSTLPRLSGRSVIEASTTPSSSAMPSVPAPRSTETTSARTPAPAPPAPLLAASTTGDTSASFLGLSTSSSATSGTFPPQTPRIYPQLNQSISQRSAAIKALFPSIHPLGDSTASTSSATSVGNTTGGSRVDTSFARSMAITGLSRKTSVKDLAKSFEEQGLLANALKRAPSGAEKVDELKRVVSRDR